eukprot:8318078-Ditylum_brightwellii.AAC.1
MISSLGSKQHDCNDVQQKESFGDATAVEANLQTSVEVSQTTNMILGQTDHKEGDDTSTSGNIVVLESSSNESACNNGKDNMLTTATIQSSSRS